MGSGLASVTGVCYSLLLLVTVTHYSLLVTGYNSAKNPSPVRVVKYLHGPRLVKTKCKLGRLREIENKNADGVKGNLKIKLAGLGDGEGKGWGSGAGRGILGEL